MPRAALCGKCRPPSPPTRPESQKHQRHARARNLPNGTAAAGVEHLDPSMLVAPGYRADVAVHPPGGTWGASAQISPVNRLQRKREPYAWVRRERRSYCCFSQGTDKRTRDACCRSSARLERRVGLLEDVTGSDITSDVYRPELGVAPDGSAVIAFQYVHYAGSKTLDVNLVTRDNATGPGQHLRWCTRRCFERADGHRGIAHRPSVCALQLSGHQLRRTVALARSGRSPAATSPPARTACRRPTSNPGMTEGVSFLGNDAYFGWSGQPNGGESSCAEGSRWLDGSPSPTASPTSMPRREASSLEQVVADEDGSVAVFWNARCDPENTS